MARFRNGIGGCVTAGAMENALLFLPPFYAMAAILGAVGQSLRGALGLMKHYREEGVLRFDPVLYGVTLALGAVSGLLGSLVYDLPGTSPSDVTFASLTNDRNFILMAIASGYFGADVIEGILGKHDPSK